MESRLLGFPYFPYFPYSVISMACFGNAFHKITITAKARWEQEPLVRDDDYSATSEKRVSRPLAGDRLQPSTIGRLSPPMHLSKSDW